jgi:hypothetical protein
MLHSAANEAFYTTADLTPNLHLRSSDETNDVGTARRWRGLDAAPDGSVAPISPLDVRSTQTHWVDLADGFVNL